MSPLQFDIPDLPRPIKELASWAIQAEISEPAIVGVGFYPVSFMPLWSLWSGIDIARFVVIHLQILEVATQLGAVLLSVQDDTPRR